MTGKTKNPRPSVSSLAVLTVSPPSRRKNPAQPPTLPRRPNAATLIGTTQLSRCDHETKISYEKKLFSYESGLTLSYDSTHHGSTKPLRADDASPSQIRSGHPPAPLSYPSQTTNPKLAQSCNAATTVPPNPSAQTTPVPARYGPPILAHLSCTLVRPSIPSWPKAAMRPPRFYQTPPRRRRPFHTDTIHPSLPPLSRAPVRPPAPSWPKAVTRPHHPRSRHNGA